MKNGYEIHWTNNALIELENIILYLEANLTEKEIRNLAMEIEKTVLLISKNPFLFQESDFKKTIRKAVVLSKNSLYYRIYGKRIEILSFYLNKKNPKKKI